MRKLKPIINVEEQDRAVIVEALDFLFQNWGDSALIEWVQLSQLSRLRL
jgi:hypothetical protein